MAHLKQSITDSETTGFCLVDTVIDTALCVAHTTANQVLYFPDTIGCISAGALVASRSSCVSGARVVVPEL
jgi:hypothetical protein